MTNIILFPNMRTPLILIIRQFNRMGYDVSNNRHGRLVLVRSRA